MHNMQKCIHKRCSGVHGDLSLVAGACVGDVTGQSKKLM